MALRNLVAADNPEGRKPTNSDPQGGGGYDNAFAANMKEQGWTGPSMDDMYGQLSGALAGGSTPMFLDAREKERQEQQRPAPENREMSSIDNLFARANKFGESLANITGFSDAAQNGASMGEQVGRFFPSLPAQIAAAPFSAAANIYEAATGRPVNEGDLEDNTMPYEDLDANQRAASAAQGALDVFGTLTGGSGRAIGGAINVGRAALGTKNAAKPVMQGWVTKAGGSSLGQVASDVLEESAEEAASSAIQDVRYEQFGEGTLERALESAGWGALGGGVMSGAGVAANKFAEKLNGQPQDQGTPDENAKDDSRPDGTDFFALENIPDRIGMPTAPTQKRYEEIMSQSSNRDVPGSSSYTVLPGSLDIGLEEGDIGVRGMKTAFQHSRDDGEVMAENFGVAYDDMAKAISIMDMTNEDARATAAEMLGVDPSSLVTKSREDLSADVFNSWIDKGYGGEFTKSRDPYTSQGGNVRFKVRRVTPGNGIRLNPMLSQISGGDIDGDTLRVYRTENIVDRTPWASELMLSQNTGKAVFKWEYMNVTKNEDVLDQIHRLLTSEDGFGKPIGEKIYRNYVQAIEGTGNHEWIKFSNMEDRLSNMFAEAYNEYQSRQKKYIDNGKIIPEAYKKPAHQKMSEILYKIQLLGQTEAQISKMSDALGSDVVANINADRNALINEVAMARYEGGIGQTKGRLKGDTKYLVQMIDVLDMVGQRFTTKENPYLRDHQAINWMTKEARFFDQVLDTLPDDNVFEEFILYQLNLLEKAQNPIKQIEATFKAYVYRSMRSYMEGNHIGGKIGRGEFADRFVEVYNHFGSIFNRAMKERMYDGTWIAPLTAPKKKDIDKFNHADFNMAFLDIFGDDSMGSVLSINEAEEWAGMSFNEFLGYASTNSDVKYLDFFNVIDTESGAFMRSLLGTFPIKEKMVEKRYDGLFEDIADVNKELRQKKDVEWAGSETKYRQSQYAKISMVVRSIQSVVGYDASLYFNMASVESFMSSEWSKYFLSEDADVVKNACVSFVMSYKFAPYMRAVSAGRNEEALGYISCISQDSKLDKFIATVIDSGDNRILKYMADPRVPYSKKQEIWDRCETALAGVSKNLFVNAMSIGNEKLSGGELSNRMKTAALDIKAADKVGTANGLDMLEKVRGFITSGKMDAVKVMDAIENISERVVGFQQYDAVYASIVDSLSASKKRPDKAQAPTNSTIAYQQIMFANNENLAPVIDQLTGDMLGTSSHTKIAKNTYMLCKALFDPEYSEPVTLDDGTYAILSRENLYAQAGVTVKPGDKVTWLDFYQLMRRFPTLVSYVCPTEWVSVYTGSSEPMLVQKMSQTLDEAVKSEIEGDKEYREKVRIERTKNKILSMSGVGKIAAGIVCAKNGGVDAFYRMSPKQQTREIKNAIDDYSRMMVDLMAVDGSLAYEKLNEAIDGSRELVSESTRKAIFLSNTIIKASMDYSGIVENVTKSMKNDLMSSLIVSSMIGRSTKSSISIPKEMVDSYLESAKTLATNIVIGFNVNEGDEISNLTFKAIADKIGAKIEPNQSAIDEIMKAFNCDEEEARTRFANYAEQPSMNTSIMSGFDIAKVRISIGDVYKIVEKDADGNLPAEDESRRRFDDLVVDKIERMRGDQRFDEIPEQDYDEMFSKLYKLLTEVGNRNSATEIKLFVLRWNSPVNSYIMRESDVRSDKPINFNEYASLADAYQVMLMHYEKCMNDKDLADVRKNIRDHKVNRDKLSIVPIRYDTNDAINWGSVADMDLESGGNPVLSGIDGGYFQGLGIMATMSGNLKCTSAPRTVTVGEYMENRSLYTKAVDEEGRTVDIDAYIRRNKLSDDDEFVAYYVMDCPHGCCANHSKPMIQKTGYNYSHIKTLLFDLFSFSAEPRVLKSKKTLNVFDNIIRNLKKNDELSGFTFDLSSIKSSQDPMTGFKDAMVSYREKLSQKIYDVMSREEKLKDGFTLNDAITLAQFGTPIVQVTMGDGRIMTVSSAAFFDIDRYGREMGGIDVNDIENVRVIPLPITEVCKKIGNDLTSKYHSEIIEGRMKDIDSKKFDEDFVEALCDWSKYSYDPNGLSKMFDRMPMLGQAFNPKMRMANNSLALQKFLEMTNLRRSPSAHADSVYMNSMLKQEEREAIMTVSSQFRYSDPRKMSNGTPLSIVGCEYDESFLDDMDRINSRKYKDLIGLVMGLNGIDASKRRSQTNKAYVYFGTNVRYMRKAYDDASFLGSYLLVPKAMAKEAKDSFGQQCVHEEETIKLNEGVVEDGIYPGYKEFVVVDPYVNKAGSEWRYYHQTDVTDFDPTSVMIAWAAAAGTMGDSPSALTEESANRKELQIGSFTIRSDYVFDNECDVSIVPKIELDRVKQEYLNRGSKDSCYVDPKKDKFNPIDPEHYDTMIDAFFKSDISDNGLVDHDLMSGSVIGFLKRVGRDGFTQYTPMILNTAGMPYQLDRIIPVYSDDRRSVEFMFTAHLNLKENEGLKVMHPNTAYKSMASIRTEYQAQHWMEPGFTLYLPDGKGGQKVLYTDMAYSRETEDGRLVDHGIKYKRDNLFYGSRVIPYNVFLDKVPGSTNDYTVNYDKFKNWGWDERDIDAVLNYNDATPSGWKKFANSQTMMIFDDARANLIAKRVVKNCLDHGLNPMHVFGNIASKGVDDRSEWRQVFVMFNQNLIFKNLSRADLSDFFHALIPKLIAKSDTKIEVSKMDPSLSPILNHDGDILLRTPEGEYRYGRGHIMIPRMTETTTMMGVPASSASRSYQQEIVSNLLFGRRFSGDFLDILQYVLVRNGDYAPVAIGGSESENGLLDEMRMRTSQVALEDQDLYRDLMESNIWTKSQIEHRREVMNEGAMSFKDLMRIKEFVPDGNYVGRDDRRIEILYDNFKEAFGCGDDNCSMEIMDMFFKIATAYTYNEGRGSHTVPIDEYINVINEMIHRINAAKEKGGGEWFIEGGKRGNRYSFAMLPKEILDIVMTWDSVRKAYPSDPKKVMEIQMTQVRKSIDEIGKEKSRDRRNALNRMMEFLHLNNGLKYENAYIDDDRYLTDVYNDEEDFMEMFGIADPNTARAFKQNAREYRKRYEKMASLDDDVRYEYVETTETPSGHMIVRKDDRSKGIWKVMRCMSKTTKAMGLVASPALPLSAMIARVKAGGLMKASLWMSRNGIPIYDTNLVIKNQDAVRAAAKNDTVRKIWNALNKAQLDGDMVRLLSTAKNPEEMISMIDGFQNEDGWVDKVYNLAGKYASAEGAFMGLEIENFINFFAQRLDPEKSPWWFRKDKNGKTEIERVIEIAPEKFMISVLTTRLGTDDYIKGMQARNMAQRANMTNLTLPGLLLSNLFDRFTVAEVISTTCISRFPLYAFNVGGWFLQFVAPVSSVNYLAVDWLSKKGKIGPWDFEAMGIDRVQAVNSLREAMTIDVLHIGFSMLGGLLFALTGALEPPEDEDKMGNLDEWTLFGFRIGEEWWMTDIAGPALAIAATWTSAMNGRMRLDIIPNWFSQAMFTNPLMKVSDVVAGLMNFEDQYVEKWNDEAEAYADALTGEPSMTEVFLSNTTQGALNWVSQFFTPSLLREWYNDTQTWEKSYKRVYSEDETGLPVEDGYTMETSYFDAEVRQVSRKNPVLGFMLDLILHPNTSYMAGGSPFAEHAMPRTVYMDPEMMYSQNYYSIVNEDGSEKSETEKRRIAYEVISLLATYDDPEELAATGFSVNAETRMYVSQTLWDCCKYESDIYNMWIQRTGGDANVVGEGDFNEGYKRVQEIKQSFFDSRQQWQDLYYRLWDDSLTRGVTKYNRYNTDYLRDANGEWYATGLRPTAFGLFRSGPDTVDEAKETMGRDMDWATPSAVTGESTGMRALVPYEEPYIDIPDFESWSGDGDGDGYSDIYNGNGFDDDDSLGYGFRYGSGYGGYRGGGGGYSPSLYSRVSVPYMSSPRTMYGERLYSGDISYLRPDFQTKGSREAYKRSDI